jgi:hypothetical protein
VLVDDGESAVAAHPLLKSVMALITTVMDRSTITHPVLPTLLARMDSAFPQLSPMLGRFHHPMCQLSVAPTRIVPLEKNAKMVFASIRWFLTTPIQTTPTQKTSRRMPSIPVKHVRSTTIVVDR